MSTGGTASLSRCRASSMPSMSGMWISDSTRSVGVFASSPIASRPLPASPTTTSDSAPAQSSRSSRRRRRAGASSSTISTRSGVSDTNVLLLRGAVRHPDVDLVAVLVDAALAGRFRVEVESETLADVVDGHLVTPVVAAGGLVRIAQDGVHLAAAQANVHRDHAGSARGLDPVINGVLAQRLQHERGDQSVARHLLHVPLDVQAVAESYLLQIEILPAQLHFVGERSELAVVLHQHPKKIGEIFERGLRPARLGPDQR